jgi:peptidoglycan/LPS O-acetylase OafA/YrhL
VSVAPAPLQHRRELDGLRAVAVLAVAVFHTGLPLLRGGWVGVDVFFVLSGFLITTLLLEERDRFGRVDLPAFYARRALRLLPALAALLVAIAGAVVIGAVASSVLDDVGWIVLYLGNWPAALGEELGPLSHLWSLALEEQFYVAWPLAMLALLRWVPGERRRVAVVGGVVAAIALVRTGLYLADVVSGSRAYFGSDVRADGLLLGCTVGLAHHAGVLGRAAAVLQRLVLPAALLLVAIALFPTEPFEGIGPLLFLPVDLAAAVVIGAVVTRPGARWAALLRWEPAVRLGALSYGFYLWHVPVMKLIDLTQWQQLVVGLPLTLVAAVISRRLVELPALRLKARFRPGAERAPAGTAPVLA